MDKINTIIEATSLIVAGDIVSAEQTIKEGYPFEPVKKDGRNYTTKQMVEQFYRDGFIDRYSGEKLLNPGMLRVMSEKMPDVFPFQAPWQAPPSFRRRRRPEPGASRWPSAVQTGAWWISS